MPRPAADLPTASAVLGPAGSPVATALGAELRDLGWAVAELADPPDATQAATAATDADAVAPLRLAVLQLPVPGPVRVTDLTAVVWRDLLRDTLGATRTTARAVLRPMLAHGRGDVLLVTSSLAQVGGPEHSHVAAAHAAVHGLVRALAREVGPGGVHVNAVAVDPDADAATQAVPVLRFLATEPHFLAGQVLAPSDGAVL